MRHRKPPPRVVPRAAPSISPEDAAARAVGRALRLRDDAVAADELFEAADAHVEHKLAELGRLKTECEEALEKWNAARAAAAEAAEAYLNARAEAQRLGGAMPGECPRTAAAMLEEGEP